MNQTGLQGKYKKKAENSVQVFFFWKEYKSENENGPSLVFKFQYYITFMWLSDWLVSSLILKWLFLA